MKTAKRILRTIAITVGVVLAVEGCLQLVFRAANGHWMLRFERHRVQHLVPRDDPRGYTYKPGFRDERERITFDRLGLRVDPDAPPIPRGARVVVALGDSVPFGHCGGDADSYPARLDATLRERGSTLRVVNAGVQSYNLRQSIEHFHRDVLPNYQPVVVTLQAANDVALLLHHRDRWNPDVTWAPYRDDLAMAVVAQSATVYYATLPLRHLVAGGPDVSTARMVAHEERLLDEFLRFCASRGIRVVLMPIDPFYYGRDPDKSARLSKWNAWLAQSRGWERYFDDFNDVMAAVAGRHGAAAGVYFFDTRAYLDARDREPLYVDFIHYTAEGNRAVADGLAAFLEEQGVLDAVDGR